MKLFLRFACAVILFLQLVILGFLLGMHDCHAADVSGSVVFDLTRVRVSEVVQLVYRDVFKRPYLIDPAVLADDRLISFRLASSDRLRTDVAGLLDALGLSVVTRNGVDVIAPHVATEPADEVFVYRPQYREVGYLAELLRPLFKGKFTVTRGIAAPVGLQPGQTPAPQGSAASLIDRDSDALIFSGQHAEVVQLGKLLPQVDDRQGEVMVRGVVYEVGSTETDGSAFSLAVKLLGGRFSVAGGALKPLDNAVRFTTGSIDAVVSALSTDSRFKVVSSPSLRVRSGRTGRFSVGQEVPILGAVSYAGPSGQPVQSVEYRSSGVIFDLSPVVRAGAVDLDVGQQISSFVATDTGVNGSPTLIKREVKTSLTLFDGDVIVLGGLAENKEASSRSGMPFLPRFLQSRSSDTSRSEILLVLELKRI